MKMKVYVVTSEINSYLEVEGVCTSKDDAMTELRNGCIAYCEKAKCNTKDMTWNHGDGYWEWYSCDDPYGMKVTEKEVEI